MSARNMLRCVCQTRTLSSSATLQRRTVSQPLTDLLRAQINEREANRALDQSRREQTDSSSEIEASESGVAEPSNDDLKKYESTITPKGAIYSPEELSFEAKAPLRRMHGLAKFVDNFEQYQINPIDEYKSHNLLSEYITELGRIKPRESTGLSAKNQRRLAKAVRRARALAIIPSTSRHPEYNATQGFRGPRQDFLSRM